MSLAGSTHPSTVTSTISNGKIEKNAQKAIMAAMFADWSSLNFLNVATVTLVGLVLFWAESTFCRMLMVLSLARVKARHPRAARNPNPRSIRSARSPSDPRPGRTPSWTAAPYRSKNARTRSSFLCSTSQ